MLKSLRRRFVWITMAIITAMLLIIFFTVYHFTKVNLENKSDAMVQLLSQSGVASDPQNREVSLPYFVLEINSRGDIIASGHTHYNLSKTEFLVKILNAVSDKKQISGTLSQYQLKYKVTYLPTVTRIAFVDISSSREAMISLLETGALVGVVSLAAFTIFSILLARWVVKPVARAWEQQKQFISDASHELKTPLTVITTNAEMLKNLFVEEEPLQYSENILGSSRQMRHLVDGLLELARGDNTQIHLLFTTVDFSRTVTDSTLTYDAMLFERNILLQTRIDNDIQIEGSQQHLRQLVDILLDNVRKYSDPGIADVILYRQDKTNCLLTVSNPAAAISKEEISKIFDRFYRIDTSRSSSDSFGLGLSIAKQIVEEHGGKIWAESNQTGVRFCVQLPCPCSQ